MRTSCSEFPNDNNMLHAGTIGWFAFDGWRFERPRPVGAEREVQREVPEADVSGVRLAVEAEHEDEIQDERAVAPVVTSELPPPLDPFNVFVATLADACIAADELVAAAEIPDLFFREILPACLAEGALDELRGWRRILRGESDDLAPCGPLPLDEWSAALLGRLCQKDAKAHALRRELRARGIAAYGLVDAAA